MNISKISFGIRYDDGFDILNNSVQKKMGNTLEFSIKKKPDTDTFEPQQKVGRHEKKEPYQPRHSQENPIAQTPKYQQTAKEYLENNKRKTTRKRTILSVAGGTLAGIILAQGIAAYNQTPKLITVPSNNYSSVYEVADIYGSDADAILAYNGMKDDTEFDGKNEIKVPTMYDYVQDEIDNVQNKLYNANLNSKDRTNLEDKMARLQAKQEIQQKTATVYTDGKFVYFTIKAKGGVNVEEFKQLFDIKDKAIRENNDIEFDWGYSAEEGGYKDYTQYILTSGETIKVPVGAIKTGGNINLD